MSANSSPLSGLIAVVTGCARPHGLGRAIALDLARAGADVAVSDVTEAGLPSGEHNLADDDAGLGSVVAEIEALGRKSTALVADVGLKADADSLISDTVERLGRLDILVNNAGLPPGADRTVFWEMPEQAFDDVLRVNTKGTLLVSAAFARHAIAAKTGGRIINISSDAGRVGMPTRAAYCASKFAINGLTQVFAQELAGYGVTVNTVCPGTIHTGRVIDQGLITGPNGIVDPAQPDKVLIPNTPVGRFGLPMDIANVVTFLAGPAAGFITGQAISVNGGTLMV